MATRPNVKSFQDMPPPGGYPPINFKKGIRPRGPPGWLVLSSIICMMGFGQYAVGQTNRRRRLEQKDRREIRMTILPYHEAETDRANCAMMEDQLRAEAFLMRNNKDWKVGESVYSSHWSPPALWHPPQWKSGHHQ